MATEEDPPFRTGTPVPETGDKEPLVLLGHFSQVTGRDIRPRAVRAQHIAPQQVRPTHISEDFFELEIDVEFLLSTVGIILRSPDGTRYRVKVSNAGALSTEVVT